MKKFITAVALAATLASCGTNDVPARGHQLRYLSVEDGYYRDPSVSFLSVNPLARVGDTVDIEEQTFVIEAIDTTTKKK